MAIARQAIPDALKAKAGESDLVQETAFEAQRDFASFGGESADELLAWLRRILLNNASNFSRHYEQTEKRKVKLEFPLDSSGHNPSEIKDRGPSPIAQRVRNFA
jgi:DNA-directed RNA polymerase specialized sigma24 family protein